MLPDILIGVIAFVVALVIGIPVGVLYRKKVAEKEIISAEEEAKRIINEAIKSAESKKTGSPGGSQGENPGRKNQLRERSQGTPLRTAGAGTPSPAEGRDPGAEAGKTWSGRRNPYAARLANLEEARIQVAKLQAEQMETLERISGYTAEEAKEYLIAKLETEVTHEAAMKIKEIEARFKEEADAKAKEIVGLAIQRCAADHVAEVTVSVVPPAQRRDERADHRPGRPEHPHPGNPHRRGPHHRRHPGGHHRVLL